MGNLNNDDGMADATAGERELRGDALDGSEQKRAVDHTQKKRNPDSEVRVEGEADSLYEDGLEMEDDTPPLGTDGRNWDNAR